jgi:DNA-binding PadR family transcriptional regulator
MLNTHHVTTPQPKKSRNPAEYPVLGMLASGPAHGYDICRRLQTELGSIWNLGRSQIYALLSRLERDGLVIHERVGQENLPAKNIFRLTPSGEAVFKGWANTPVNHMRDMRLEFPTKLWFVHQTSPAEAKRLIENQLTACQAKADALAKLGKSCRTEIEALSTNLKLKVVEAAISWLEGLRKTPGPRPYSVPDCIREKKERD